jgi:hypothetical protein
VREPELLQELEAAPYLITRVTDRRLPAERDAPICSGLPLDLAIESAHVSRANAGLRCAHLVARRSRAELARRELLAPRANPVPEVFARKAKSTSVVADTANSDVEVRVIVVVVLDGDPLEPCPEVAFHRAEKSARVAPKVHPGAALRRDDELPENGIAGLLPARERRRYRDVGARHVEAEASALAVRPRALARDIAAMRAPLAATQVLAEGHLDGAPLQERRARSARPTHTERLRVRAEAPQPRAKLSRSAAGSGLVDAATARCLELVGIARGAHASCSPSARESAAERSSRRAGTSAPSARRIPRIWSLVR